MELNRVCTMHGAKNCRATAHPRHLDKLSTGSFDKLSTGDFGKLSTGREK